MPQPTAPLVPLLERIAAALERLAPPPPPPDDFGTADAFMFVAETNRLTPVREISRVALPMLHGIDRVRDLLLTNTQQFAEGFAANNALLWGARGMGKSSLIKAVHGEIAAALPDGAPRLILIEIHRDDIPALPLLLVRLRPVPERFILFCDDLSFDHDDSAYKSLKAVLDGGIEGRPSNVVLYATSNRRHLMPRDMIDNERSTAVNPGEAVEEKISLSDRFGLWLGFHSCDQTTYLAMIRGYVAHYRIEIDDTELARAAGEWALTRGGRSGRVAWQFVQDLAGRLRWKLD
ncbi:MAG: ATP-binding protein [Aliidongia sp.]